MSRLRILVLLTFIESVAAILGERGIYFYAHQYLLFADWMNLWLSLTIGLGYISGAMLSHRAAARWGERNILLATIFTQCVMNLLLTRAEGTTLFFILNFSLAMATGMKWPVVESYVSAGLNPKSISRMLGHFNITWASAVPLSIIAAGFLIDHSSTGMFYLGAGINIVSFCLVLKLERKPVHLTDDHPDRLPAVEQKRYRAMCACARWNLVSSYTLMFVLAPLAPSIAAKLGYHTALAGTILMSLMEVMRVVAFVILQSWTRWHGRPSLLVLSSFLVPIGCAMVLFGNNLPVVLLGQFIFGSACGVVYYAAIYYAMVTHNASVDAGGFHEALIGGGFALGPAIGLIGVTLQGPLGGQLPGMMAALGPVAAVCFLAGLVPVVKMRRYKAPADIDAA